MKKLLMWLQKSCNAHPVNLRLEFQCCHTDIVKCMLNCRNRILNDALIHHLPAHMYLDKLL